MIRDGFQQTIYKIINPLVRLMIKIGLTPNIVTMTGLVLNIGVAVILLWAERKVIVGDLSYVGWAGMLTLFAGLFDMLDGQVARLGNMASVYGALFDSVLDRYSELFLFLGICYYLVAHHYFIGSLIAFVGLIGLHDGELYTGPRRSTGHREQRRPDAKTGTYYHSIGRSHRLRGHHRPYAGRVIINYIYPVFLFMCLNPWLYLSGRSHCSPF